MAKSTSIEAFKKNVQEFVRTLQELGFTLQVSSFDDETKEELETLRATTIQNLLSMDVEKEQNRDNLNTLTWFKSNTTASSVVYAHIDFESSSHLSSTTFIREIKVLINDERNALPSKEYRKINMPSVKVLKDRIQQVEDANEKYFSKTMKDKALREKNLPIFIDAAKKVFGEELVKNNSNWSVNVEYKGAKLHISTNQTEPMVNIDVFGLDKNISLEKARQIIDMMND